MYRVRFLYFSYFFILLILSSFVLQSCYKFSTDQTVPSYIKIDSVFIQTNYGEEGTPSHKITDVWVYFNKNLLGVYELPALFPVLGQGVNDLEIRPGIWLNGISSTRVPYPFYKPIVYSEFNFIPDSIHDLKNISTTYYDNLVFDWMEDFESAGLTLVETSASDTVIEITSPANNPEAFLSPNSKYSGLISLTEDNPIYSAISMDAFPIPTIQSNPVLLELNFKSNNLFNVGLLMNLPSGVKKVPLLIMNHSDEWNKIYINLGPNISINNSAANYKVYFEAGLEYENNLAEIYLDNIKLIYRPIQ